MSHPTHVSSLKKSDIALTTSDGRPIAVWELNIGSDTDLSAWAKHFRQQYCHDAEIDQLREGTGLSRSDYLVQLLFPDEKAPPGPSIRAGDFAEILISDFLEYSESYWVPRGKYADKAVRNESVKGVDIVGFKLTSPASPLPSDTLIAFEVKAQLSNAPYDGCLQRAVVDSEKDYLRRAMTLNATKCRLHNTGQSAQAAVVQRFQNAADHPYIYRSGAAAVVLEQVFDPAAIQGTTDLAGHNNRENLELLIVKGVSMMALVNSLYKRAADEA